jgi:hypothetical protein
MSDLTAKVTKDNKGSIVVDGYEALKYNFHFTSPVFDVSHEKLASIYERWARVLIVIDTSELPPLTVTHVPLFQILTISRSPHLQGPDPEIL